MKWPALQHNSRFYILASTLLVSIMVACFLRLQIPSDQLYLIRLQQVYGLLAVLLLYCAIILTPLQKLLPKAPFMPQVLFARRAIGVSAAYFSLLHTVIAVFDQVGGLGNLSLLPERFKWAFVLGALALLILLLMAGTSFDRVIDKMTFPRWKKLHRFVYLAGILIIIHIWLIGTHSDSTTVRLFSAIALALLFALESVRIVQKTKLTRSQKTVTGLALFTLLTGSLFLLPALGGNYHSDHHESSIQHES
jgi:methionine sulfoxide reductase heme-binding subunit